MKPVLYLSHCPLGNIFHVQVSTPADNFVLDHALLYCIGVNLPNHTVGQLDRVLVVASAINDVNLHAWNLSRVKRFMIIEAGIQMELCGNCMGHRKKTVTFLISPEFIHDCIEFLVKEARLHSEPKQMAGDGPLYYTSPHSCSSVVAESPTTACPMYTNAEMIVLGKEGQKAVSSSTGLYINYDGRGRSFSTITCRSDSSQQAGSTAAGSKSATMQPQHPSLPPRGVMRNEEPATSPGQASAGLDTASLSTTTTTTMTTTTTHHFDNKPYQINHRIYVKEDGGVREDPHVFGSGTWEHDNRKGKRSSNNKPPVAPPRSDDSGPKPLYVEDNDINIPSPPFSSTLSPPQGFQRPDFIGRNPPCLPPRNTDSPLLSHRSTSDSNLLSGTGFSPDIMRRNSEHPSTNCEGFLDDDTAGISLTQPFDDKPPAYQNVGEWTRSHTMTSGQRPTVVGPTYVNQRFMRSPSPQMCTDDISNADFALITKLSFTSGSILPPRNQPRKQPQQQQLSSSASRRPVPVPRNRKQEQFETSIHTGSSMIEPDVTSPPPAGPPATTAATPSTDKDSNNNNKSANTIENSKDEEEKAVSEERVKNDDEGMSYNPLYFNIGAGRSGSKQHQLLESTHVSGGSLHKHTFEIRASFSSSSLDSDDYKRHSRKSQMAIVQKQYSHEV